MNHISKFIKSVVDTAYKLSKNDISNNMSMVDKPDWLCGPNLYSYCINDTEYLISHDGTSSDVEWVINGQRMNIISVPIVTSDYNRSVKISTPFETYQIDFDESYDYPTQIWVEFEIPDHIDEFVLNISSTGSASKSRLPFQILTSENAIEKTRMGLPALYPKQSCPPIFLISIDTLPYSERSSMQPLLDALGPDAVVPSEPRTQGYWTAPSHASMFTGSHPGDHGYVGHGKAEGDERPINPDMTTLSELLTNNGYKCSGLVSHTRILPEFGFGRGCHRYRADTMSYSDWITRDHDSSHSVNQLINWVNSDMSRREHSLFYFLHVFDPHYPYLPPLEYLNQNDIDFTKAKQYRKQYSEARGEIGDYLHQYQNNHSVDAELITEMEQYLSMSVEYTAAQIARLVDYLRTVDLFDESLIIVTGDHGEEFGERGFFTHSSLYDRNIRPFMAIKPPTSADWSVPDAVDTIDFLPTIAQLIDAEIPSHCTGHPIQTKQKNTRPRITERIRHDWYNVSIEAKGFKGIFTYKSGYPNRPAEPLVLDGPVLTEFYEQDAVRSGDFSECELPPNAAELQQLAEDFILENNFQYRSEASATKPSQETKDRLKDLGYM